MFAPLWEAKFFERRGEKVFVLYSELLYKLICTDKTLHERAIKYFINLFLGDKRPDLRDDDKLTKPEQKLFLKVHYFLRTLCSRFSNVQAVYLDLILNSFPFATICTVHNFVCYFSNCSSIYLFESDENREKVLWRLIERLINIDSYRSNVKLSRLFDVGLCALFRFVNKICLRGDLDLAKVNTLVELRAAVNGPATDELFGVLQSIFITQVIQMDQTTSVNLVVLYVCALKEELAFRIVDLIWNEAFEVPNAKPAAVNYFCSFLCAASWISVDTLIGCMLNVSKKINNYLLGDHAIVDDDLDNFHKTLKKHKYFYAMCNCLFKLVVARSDEYTDKHINQLSQLNVQRIITCSLNPLAVCPIEIVKRFADICKFYQLGLCNMILQRNRRIGLYDLLKKREVKFKLVYPFDDLRCPYDKLSLVYRC